MSLQNLTRCGEDYIWVIKTSSFDIKDDAVVTYLSWEFALNSLSTYGCKDLYLSHVRQCQVSFGFHGL